VVALLEPPFEVGLVQVRCGTETLLNQSQSKPYGSLTAENTTSRQFQTTEHPLLFNCSNNVLCRDGKPFLLSTTSINKSSLLQGFNASFPPSPIRLLHKESRLRLWLTKDHKNTLLIILLTSQKTPLYCHPPMQRFRTLSLSPSTRPFVSASAVDYP
jgi:hypothetical protein